MSIADIIRTQGIVEVLHFTTDRGLVGILDSGFLRSRARLSDDQRLSFILKLNTPRVLDLKWIDYVNLSITGINSTLYSISSDNWHKDVEWRILSFEPEIMCHDGVLFVTTNNAYPAAVRGAGAAYLAKLFDDPVSGRYGAQQKRYAGMSDAMPTDEQAEVLYPGEVSTSFLRCIYVASNEQADDVCGLLEAVQHPAVSVIVAPDKFVGRMP